MLLLKVAYFAAASHTEFPIKRYRETGDFYHWGEFILDYSLLRSHTA